MDGLIELTKSQVNCYVMNVFGGHMRIKIIYMLAAIMMCCSGCDHKYVLKTSIEKVGDENTNNNDVERSESDISSHGELSNIVKSFKRKYLKGQNHDENM